MWEVSAAAYAKAEYPSSMSSSGGPIIEIWKKWSITQSEVSPASSALRDPPEGGLDGGRCARPGEVGDLQPEVHRLILHPRSRWNQSSG